MAGGKKMPVLQMLGDFADNTSAHGVRKLHEKSHWLFKVIWLLLLLTATGNVFMQVWHLINQFERRPVTIKTTIHSRSLKFPTVTLCNLNPFKYSEIQKEEFPMETLRQISGILNISLEQFGGATQTGQAPVDTETRNITQDAYYSDDTGGEFSVSQFLTEAPDQFRTDTLLTLTETSEIQRLAQPMSELLVSCFFAGSPCRHNEFSWFYDLDYMNCFQFPRDNSTRSREVYSAGQVFGLSLILNVDQKEYVPFVTPSAGIRVAIHEYGSSPNLMQKGLTAPPGFETSIGIRPVIRIHQPHPYGNCETDNPYGDIQTCERRCLEDLIEIECECSRRINNPNNITYVCSAAQGGCIKTVIKQMQKGNLTCSTCRISCREHGYIQRVSMATWPADHYDMALKTVINKEKSLGDIDTRKNLVSLNIFFSELIEEVVQEEPAYMWENLQSDIGGQLGLWLGISVLSLCEVVELFLKMIGTCCKSTTDNKITHVAPMNEK
ncbi:amiloride-sensitive sodium channel subunit beta-like [Haliotis asinina]|uniref:amiloride-sensitive sodium channel subunit beta-like n=1 Tax=Haliotis asinina TaxID=109174 RepID=UPI0035321EFB